MRSLEKSDFSSGSHIFGADFFSLLFIFVEPHFTALTQVYNQNRESMQIKKMSKISALYDQWSYTVIFVSLHAWNPFCQTYLLSPPDNSTTAKTVSAKDFNSLSVLESRSRISSEASSINLLRRPRDSTNRTIFD